MPLNSQQSDRLQSLITELENLVAATDEAGARDILDEAYLLVTNIYEKFPQLDTEEDD